MFDDCDCYKEIVDILVELRKDVTGNGCKCEATDICSVVKHEAAYSVYSMWCATCEDAFESWDKFSGDRLYPVPSPDGSITPKDCYRYTSNRWVGDYGKLRMELLNHLIEWYSDRVD